MALKSVTKIALEKILFVERYKKLSERYCFDTSQIFTHFNTEEVIRIFNELGYKATYNKNESFFKVIEKTPLFKFQFNISLKHGVVELIWAIWKDKMYFDGDAWAMLKRWLEGTDENLRYPGFRNYVDLREILSEAFLIYEDFKCEFLANNML